MSTDQPNREGRPSKYKPEYIDAILEYFSVEPYEEKTKRVASQGKQIEIDYTDANDMPTFAGFACSIEVHRGTLHEWCRDYPEFYNAYKRAGELQENFLVINGLKSTINTAFGIFTAKNVLGWRDKVENNHTFDDIEFEDDNDE